MALDLSEIEPSAENAAKYLPPYLMGPVWQKDENGGWLLPERTLGWGVLRWCATYLTDPDTGKPWMFTPEQARFVLWMYEVDCRGRRVYREAVLQRLKGWGKDPLAAALCIVELVGPVLFDRLDDSVRGGCVGRENRNAWVQIVGVAKDQTKNTMLILPSLIPKETRTLFSLEVQKEIIQVIGYPNRRIEVISASYRAMEGNRPSFGVANETHHWIPSRGGQDMYLTLRNNLDKRQGFMLAITNAFMPGEGSVAQDMRETEEDVLNGRAEFGGVLYDSLEAHPDSPLTPDWAPYIVDTIRGDAHWIDVETIVMALQNSRIPPSRLRRFWYNQVVASEDALITVPEWDGIHNKGAALRKGEAVVLGFDGGRTDDATALVALRLSDLTAFPISIWQKPEGPAGDTWEVPVESVDSMVHMCFRELDVRAFFADVALWESYIDKWSDQYREQLRIKASPRSAIGYDMRNSLKILTHTNEALVQAIRDGRIQHNGDRLLRSHVLNTRQRENSYGTSFGKESRESPKKVDGYAALLLAYLALTMLNESGKNEDRSPGNYYQF